MLLGRMGETPMPRVPASELTFWVAETYHQDYITNHPERTCHARVKRFEE